MLETAIVEDRPRSLEQAAEADQARARAGVEQVVHCSDCRTPSTMTLGGRAAFSLRIRGTYRAVYLCPPCAASRAE